MTRHIHKSGKREQIAFTVAPEGSDRRKRFGRSFLVPTKRRVRAVPGGINNQMVGIAIAAVMAVVGGTVYVGFLSSAHGSAANTTLASALTTANSIYSQQDGFVALPGQTSFGTSLTATEPSLTFTASPGTTKSSNAVVYGAGNGSGTTGQPQSAEFVAADGSGHCFFALVVASSSSSLVTGTAPAGVTGPGTYYAAAPASAGACSIAGVVGALPTGAAYPSSGTAMAAWQTVPIAS